MVVFTEPCGRVVVNIRNIEAPPRCPRLIFIEVDIIMFPVKPIGNFTDILFFGTGAMDDREASRSSGEVKWKVPARYLPVSKELKL